MYDITEIIAHIDLSKGVRRADRIVNGLVVLSLAMAAFAAWVWL